MNTYEETVLNTLSDKYPGYLFVFEEYPSMFIVRIENISSGYTATKRLLKYSDVSLIMRAIERMIDEMREEELKIGSTRLEKAFDWLNKNSHYGMWPNKYSITPKELIFQDEKTTIINWNDGTKTKVRCSDDDTFSPEAGVALCYMKRFITDNDSERFHRLLKSLIVDISKVRYSKEVKNDHDTGALDNTGDNDPDNTSLEMES